MSETPNDWQRWQDELERCRILSLAVTVDAVPPVRTRQLKEARYHANRYRILARVGPERAVAFLREEVLTALAGEGDVRAVVRWFRLHALEFGGPVIDGTWQAMEAGVQKLVAEGVADRVAEFGRAQRAWEATHCPTCPGGICDGSCF